MRSATGEYSLSPSRRSDFGMPELDESRNGNGIGLQIIPEEIPKSIAELYELGTRAPVSCLHGVLRVQRATTDLRWDQSWRPEAFDIHKQGICLALALFC